MVSIEHVTLLWRDVANQANLKEIQAFQKIHRVWSIWQSTSSIYFKTLDCLDYLEFPRGFCTCVLTIREMHLAPLWFTCFVTWRNPQVQRRDLCHPSSLVSDTTRFCILIFSTFLCFGICYGLNHFAMPGQSTANANRMNKHVDLFIDVFLKALLSLSLSLCPAPRGKEWWHKARRWTRKSLHKNMQNE